MDLWKWRLDRAQIWSCRLRKGNQRTELSCISRPNTKGTGMGGGHGQAEPKTEGRKT